MLKLCAILMDFITLRLMIQTVTSAYIRLSKDSLLIINELMC